MCCPAHGVSPLFWLSFWAPCWYLDAGRTTILPDLPHQQNQLPLNSAPRTRPFPTSTADRGSTLWRRLSSRSRTSSIGRRSRWTGAGPDLPYLGLSNQLVGGGSQPVFLASRRHREVVGPRLRRHLTEELASDAFGRGGALSSSAFRSEGDDQQVRRRGRRAGRTTAGRTQDTVCRQRRDCRSRLYRVHRSTVRGRCLWPTAAPGAPAGFSRVAGGELSEADRVVSADEALSRWGRCWQHYRSGLGRCLGMIGPCCRRPGSGRTRCPGAVKPNKHSAIRRWCTAMRPESIGVGNDLTSLQRGNGLRWWAPDTRDIGGE